MVIKTDDCYFSRKKVFPGHGIRFIHKNGKMLIFGGSKEFRLHLQSKKAAKLKWTVDWRRKHKKQAILTSTRRVKKKSTKVNRAIEGMALKTILERQKETDAARKAQKEKKLRMLKEQRQKASFARQAP